MSLDDEFYPIDSRGGHNVATIAEEDEPLSAAADHQLTEEGSARIRELPKRGRPKKTATNGAPKVAKPRRQLRGNSVDIDVVNE